jgi:hypothetical protein
VRNGNHDENIDSGPQCAIHAQGRPTVTRAVQLQFDKEEHEFGRTERDGYELLDNLKTSLGIQALRPAEAPPSASPSPPSNRPRSQAVKAKGPSCSAAHQKPCVVSFPWHTLLRCLLLLLGCPSNSGNAQP